MEVSWCTWLEELFAAVVLLLDLWCGACLQ